MAQESYRTIYLFPEGTFYRAYEWSAWLCQRYFTELKVTHRLLKGGEDIIFVGFPPRSPEFAIREARISAFAMRENNNMRLPWYDNPYNLSCRAVTPWQPQD